MDIKFKVIGIIVGIFGFIIGALIGRFLSYLIYMIKIRAVKEKALLSSFDIGSEIMEHTKEISYLLVSDNSPNDRICKWEKDGRIVYAKIHFDENFVDDINVVLSSCVRAGDTYIENGILVILYTKYISVVHMEERTEAWNLENDLKYVLGMSDFSARFDMIRRYYKCITKGAPDIPNYYKMISSIKNEVNNIIKMDLENMEDEKI